MTPVMLVSELNRITTKDNLNTAVKAIFPVTFAEPGIKPIILLISIKKNMVSRKGRYFS
jgi:hypothetical protein